MTPESRARKFFALYSSLTCLSAILLWFFPTHATSQTNDATGLLDPSKAELIVAPGLIRPTNGAYPKSLPLIFRKRDCPADHTKDFGKTSTYSVTVAGPGLTIPGSATAIGCQLTFTLVIDATVAAAGYVLAAVVEHPTDSTGKMLPDVNQGNAVLTFLDSAAGPIPANPQVDVIWGVLSKHLCGDNFGGHIAKDLYCIEVKIGNNTGYPLQLAGIGFKPRNGMTFGQHTVPNLEPTPNISYQSVRASAQAFAILSGRNLLVNTPTALGILMASFNPFFRTTFNTARWAAGTAVVGTAFPSAVNVISQDMTVKQLNNLDDQSFRDGKTIPNNTQIRTMVFIERTAFNGIGKKSYEAACEALYGAGSPSTKPDKHKKAGDDKPGDATVQPGVPITSPDNSPLKKDIDKCKKSNDDPTAVKLALGSLIIVGDEISFIQRLVVDPSVQSQEVNPAPIVTGVAATSSTTSSTVTASITSSTNESPLAAIITSQANPASSTLVPLDSSSTLPAASFTTKTPLDKGTYNIQFLFPKSASVSVTGVPIPAPPSK